ncbi:MAG: c-type cytochrome [Hyphomicrobiales bacterium]
MRTVLIEILIVLVAVAGLGVGWMMWDRPVDWYAADISKLGPGPENDLIRYGRELVVNTPRYIGKSAENPDMRYAGNDLSCQSCHLKAGLQPFAAPFVSTVTSFPMMVDNKVIPLSERINSCIELGLNGRPLPADSREIQALVAYMVFLGKGTPKGVRVPGMGLMPLAFPEVPPDARRGIEVYARHCASCHGADGEGAPKASPEVGYDVPPLWGGGSFNGGAGMGKIAYAASYIHANMPPGADYEAPVLTVQQAWDVAAYINSKPHPVAPPEKVEAPAAAAADVPDDDEPAGEEP